MGVVLVQPVATQIAAFSVIYNSYIQVSDLSELPGLMSV